MLLRLWTNASPPFADQPTVTLVCKSWPQSAGSRIPEGSYSLPVRSVLADLREHANALHVGRPALSVRRETNGPALAIPRPRPLHTNGEPRDPDPRSY